MPNIDFFVIYQGAIISLAAVLVVGLMLRRSLSDMLRFGVAGVCFGTFIFSLALDGKFSAWTTKVVTFISAGYTDLIVGFLQANLPDTLKKIKNGILKSNDLDTTDRPDDPDNGSGG